MKKSAIPNKANLAHDPMPQKCTRRDDCYYTDTDSVVLATKLPDECLSKDELGKY